MFISIFMALSSCPSHLAKTAERYTPSEESNFCTTIKCLFAEMKSFLSSAWSNLSSASHLQSICDHKEQFLETATFIGWIQTPNKRYLGSRLLTLVGRLPLSRRSIYSHREWPSGTVDSLPLGPVKVSWLEGWPHFSGEFALGKHTLGHFEVASIRGWPHFRGPD